jgi:hypothetical protein
MEMGLTPGTAVTFVRRAPLYDPIEIRVRGYQLCVRRSEADAVWVQCDAVRTAQPAPRWIASLLGVVTTVLKSVVGVVAALDVAGLFRSA